MKKYLFVILCTLTVFLNGCGVITCGQKVTREYLSPNKSKTVVWVARNCGATTANLSSTYLISPENFLKLDVDDPKIRKKYRIFQSERGTIKPRWLSDSHIEVLYDFSPQYGRTGQFFKQRDKVSGVTITYTQMDRKLIYKK